MGKRCKNTIDLEGPPARSGERQRQQLKDAKEAKEKVPSQSAVHLVLQKHNKGT